MAPRFPVKSRTRARTKKRDPFARCFSKAELGRGKGGSGAGISGRDVRQRASSVSDGWGTGAVAGDEGHEVIIITDNEDGSDKVISVSGSGVEEEEEPCDYRLQFEPSQVSRKGENIVVDVGVGDSDQEGSTDVQSDDDLVGCGEVRSFGKQGEGNGRSFGSKNDDYAQNVSRKNTPLVTKDSESDLSSDALSSSTESSSEADDSNDEHFVAYTSEHLSTEEYVLGSERDENLERREGRKCEDKGKLSCLYSATKNNKKLAPDCIDYPMVNNVGNKKNVSWVDAGEKKEEEAIDVDRLNREIDYPANADNGNSGQKEEGRSSSAMERGGSRETEETGCRGKDDNERLQEVGKAAAEFDVAIAETDVSFVNEKGKMGEMEERGNLRQMSLLLTIAAKKKSRLALQ